MLKTRQESRPYRQGRVGVINTRRIITLAG